MYLQQQQSQQQAPQYKIHQDLVLPDTYEDEDLSYLFCNNCYSLLNEQQSYKCSNCEHIICYDCLQQQYDPQTNQYKCSDQNCTSNLKPEPLDSYTKNHTKELKNNIKIHCVSHVNSQNDSLLKLQNQTKKSITCQAILNYQEYQAHCQACQYIQVQCSNQSCSQPILRNQQNEHKNACLFEIQDCEYCNNKFIRKEIKQHEQKCYKKVQCQHCLEYKSVDIIEQHQKMCKETQSLLKNSIQMINTIIDSLNYLPEEEIQERYKSTMEIIQFLMQDQEKEKQEELKQIKQIQQEGIQRQTKLHIEVQQFQEQNQIFKQEIQQTESYLNSMQQSSTIDESKNNDNSLIDENQIVLQQLNQRLNQINKELKSLRKQYLKQANEECMQKNYWKKDWGKFEQECGDDNSCHDPLNIPFAKVCYKCSKIYQRYKQEELGNSYLEDQQNLQESINALKSN